MYVTLNTLKFCDIYKLQLLKFLHFILYDDNLIFNENLSHLLPSHTYNTRGTRINLPSVRLQIEKNFTLFKLCELLNELPEELILPQSKIKLKRDFLNYAVSQYED